MRGLHFMIYDRFQTLFPFGVGFFDLGQIMTMHKLSFLEEF